jgi:hypothetical protein
LVLADRGTLVAILALHCGVSPEKWEAILVFFNLLDGHIPSEDGVALRAIRTHLPPVNIGVTILTVLARVREYRLDVALGALHLLVHTAKWILSLVVIELRG